MPKHENDAFCRAAQHTSLTRRGFLQVGMMGAFAVSLPEEKKPARRIPAKVVVGAHPWVYAATRLNYDIVPILARIFSDMKYAGMDGIELMHTALRPKDAVDRIGELKEKHKLTVIGTSFGGAFWNRSQHSRVLDDAQLVITRLAQLGGKTLGTSVGRVEGKKTPEQLDAQAELLLKVITICKRHGVVLNLHNHTYEVENDLHDLKGTLRRIPGIKLGPDLDWLVQGGVDPVAFLRQYGDRVVFLHLRDQKKDKTWVESLGEGDMDYQAVARALKDIKFRGHAVIELAHPKGFKLTRPLRESLRMSREFVRRELGY